MTKCIIVEGPDGAGKSTLLKRLERYLGKPVYHTGGPVASKVMFLEKLREAEARMESHLLDRTPHISEPIYARAGSRRTFVPEHELHERLRSRNPVVVYCRLSSMATMFRNMDRGKKAHKSPEHLAEVMRNYKAIVEDYDLTMSGLRAKGITVIRYDWENDDLARLVEALS